MYSSLKGKVIAVVGGTSGMGLAIARAVCAAGGAVAALGREDDYLAPARRELAGLVMAGDASQSSSAEMLVAEAWRKLDGLHGLVHVAGGSGRAFGDGPLHELADEGLEKTLELNFHSVVWSNRAAVRTWLERGCGGSIVNLGSVLARSPEPRHFLTVAYPAAKAAVEGFTRSIAAAYAPHGIRANVIAPGLVETPMSHRAAESAEIMEFVRTKQPLDGGRIGQPEDVTGAALYFLSDDSRFCTGQVLAVDGGWSGGG
ncbi:MAG TPA: SDR family oxidoreductase [Verrucomicrobiales bacterium]|nr:SDR family oxidoreductase [Verrucomicrobiales bacterium]